MSPLPAEERPAVPPSAETFVFAASNWRSSLVAHHVAAIFLRERTGTPASVVVSDSPDPTAPVRNVTNGAAHAVLEAWPNMRAPLLEPALADSVDTLTTLGPLARVGWFFPSYMLAQYPWLEDFDAINASTRATLAADVFDGNVIAGPSGWSSEEACQVGGIFDNLGYADLGPACTRLPNEAALVAELEARYVAGDAFLMYLWRPLHVHHVYDMTRATLKCNDPVCYAALACDYPSTELFKLSWSEVPLVFMPLVVNFLRRFELDVEAVEAVAALAADESSEAVAAAACQWLGDSANEQTLVDLVQQERVLSVTSSTPTVVAARGGTTIMIAGSGFGRVKPNVFAADVGGVPCLRTKWLSQFWAECVVPPGSGENVDITMQVGVSVVKLEDALSYEPAALHRVSFPGDAQAGERAASAGQRLTVLGDGFVRSALMQCRIGGITVQAAFVNYTAVVCVVPALPPVALEDIVLIEVTNDGRRWRSGIELDPLGSMVWPGGVVGVTPLDVSEATSPAQITIATAFANLVDESTDPVRVAIQHINADPDVLPFTTVRLLEVNIEYARDMDAGAREAALATTMERAKAENPDMVGCIGPMFSSVALPMAAASAASATPWLTVTNLATNVDLSDVERFPYFMRTLGNDDNIVVGIVEILAVMEETLVASKLLDPDTRAVGAFVADDDVFSVAVLDVFVREAGRVGLTVDPIVHFQQAQLSSDSLTAQAEVQAMLEPLGRSDVRVVCWALNAFANTADIVAGAAAAGVADDSHLLLVAFGAVAQPLPFALLVDFVDGPDEHPIRDEILALSDVDSPGVDPVYPLTQYDAAYMLARAVDHLIPLKRSAVGADYTDAAELAGVIRARSALWPTESGFGGISRDSNDAITPRLGVWTVQSGVSRAVGAIEGGFVVLEDDIALPNGAGFSFVEPANVTVAVLMSGGAEGTADRDLFGASGMEAAMRELNALVAAGAGGRRHDASSSWVSRAHMQLDMVDVSEDAGGVAAGLDRLLARVDAHPAGPLHKLVGVVTLNSADSLGVQAEAAERNIAVLSPSATLDALSDPVAFPEFASVVARNSRQAEALADLARTLEWRTLATVFVEDGGYAASLESNFVAAAAPLDLNVARRVSLPPGGSVTAATASLQGTVDDDIRVYVLFAVGVDACAAVRGAMATSPPVIGTAGFLWLGVDGWIGSNMCGAAGKTVAVQDTSISAAEGSIGTQPVRELGLSSAAAVRRIEATVLSLPRDDIVTGDAALTALLQTWRDDRAATYGPGGVAEGELDLHFKALRGYDLLWVLSDVMARMAFATQDVSRGREMLRFWRATSGVVGVSQLFTFTDASNSPAFAPHSVSSRRGATAVQFSLVDVGMHTERGYVDLAGCPPGTEKLAGAESCTPCRVDHYKDFRGDDECVPCPTLGQAATLTDGAEGADSVDACLCPIGLVAGDNEEHPHFPCVDCPAGGTCDRVGLRVHELVNQPGWWRGDPNSTVFSRCLDAFKCSAVDVPQPVAATISAAGPDGVIETHAAFVHDWTHSTPCTLGYSGPLCETCVHGFGRTSGGECARCGDPELGRVALAASLLAVVVVILLMMWLQAPRVASVADARRGSNTKILVTWLQTTAAFRFFDLSWPPAFQALLATQGQASTVSVTFLSVDCLVNDVQRSSGRVMLEAYFVVPLVVLGIALAVSAVGYVLRWTRDTTARAWGCLKRLVRCAAADKGADAWRKAQPTFLDVWNDWCVHGLNVAVFFLYSALVGAVFSVFDCVDVPGGGGASGGVRSYLRSDMRVSCNSGEYDQMWGVGVAGLCLYVIGIPLGYTVLLIGAHERRTLFLRSAEVSLHPSTPLATIHLEDAHAVQWAMRRVYARDLWQSVGQARMIGLSLTDVTGYTRRRRHRAVDHAARVVRAQYDAVAEELCQMLAIAEGSVFGHSVDPWRKKQPRNLKLLVANEALQSLLSEIGAAAMLNAGDGDDDGSDGDGAGDGAGAALAAVEGVREDAREEAAVRGDAEAALPLAAASGASASAAAAAAGGEAKAEPGGGGGAGNGKAAGKAAGGKSGGIRRALFTPKATKSWNTARASFRKGAMEGRREELRRLLSLLDTSFDDSVLELANGRSTLAHCLRDAADKIERVCRMQRRFGFVYLQYTARAYMFELWLMGFKTTIAAISVMLRGSGPTVQVSCGALACMLSLVALHALNPMVRHSKLRFRTLYLTPAARVLKGFVQRWKTTQGSGFSVQSAGEVWSVLRAENSGRELRRMSWRVWIPEVVSTTALTYAAFAVTVFNLLLGSIVDARKAELGPATAAADEWTDGLIVAIVTIMFVLNLGVLLLFAAVVMCDGATKVAEAIDDVLGGVQSMTEAVRVKRAKSKAKVVAEATMS